jgi:hypothetical protein
MQQPGPQPQPPAHLKQPQRKAPLAPSRARRTSGDLPPPPADWVPWGRTRAGAGPAACGVPQSEKKRCPAVLHAAPAAAAGRPRRAGTWPGGCQSRWTPARRPRASVAEAGEELPPLPGLPIVGGAPRKPRRARRAPHGVVAGRQLAARDGGAGGVLHHLPRALDAGLAMKETPARGSALWPSGTCARFGVWGLGLGAWGLMYMLRADLITRVLFMALLGFRG